MCSERLSFVGGDQTIFRTAIFAISIYLEGYAVCVDGMLRIAGQKIKER